MEMVTEYAAWLERVRSTYDTVRFTCRHRLGDDVSDARVAVRVVAGLIGSPRVFRYQGLTYSGKVGSLVEPLITEAVAGTLPGCRDWAVLRDALTAVPSTLQRVFILTCVHGFDDDQVACALDCSSPEAARLRRDVLRCMSDIAELAVHQVPPTSPEGASV